MRTVRTWPTLGAALTYLGTSFGTYLKAILLLQGVSVLLVFPALAWLFELALDQAGVEAVTQRTLGQVLRSPATDLLILLIAALACLVVLVQVGALLVIAHRLAHREPVTVRTVARDLLVAARKLLSPQVLLFVPYFFVVLPLGNVGIVATVVRGIRIPRFVVGSLLETDAGTWLYYGFLAVVLYLNLRLVLTLAVFVTSDASVAASMATSWRLTRWHTWRFVVLFGIVLAVAATFLVGVVNVGLAPTRFTDRVAPDASPLVAGFSLAVVQIAVFVVTGFVAAMLAQVVVVALGVRQGEGPDGGAIHSAPAEPVAARLHGPRWVRVVVGIAGVVALAVLSVHNTSVMTDIGNRSETQVIAHRGYPSRGVENTIPSLEAAAEARAAYVEIDVQQAADGGIVVVHDTNLARLAGVDRDVYDLTTPELTATTVRARGHEASIPTLEAFVDRAQELGVPLLVEIKPHGRESPGYVEDVVALLQAKGVAGTYLVQSLDKDVVEQVESLAPEIGTGYVLPVNLGRLPATTADFVAVEESSFTPSLLAEAHAAGTKVFVWTVDEPAAMRGYVREGVDGIITDLPERAAQERDAVVADTTLSSRLEDAVHGILSW
ncbi:glycerophosphoryl diester phosphodiesterase membrane domain-containing protein [Oerskovia enterophila]|uniref:glycerophosphoryl diester phosphodiesterase membrane domain-containing protein n=1 Tax=Oerskovia enterophila TaxID=43678 RepID=UPI00381C6EE0